MNNRGCEVASSFGYIADSLYSVGIRQTILNSVMTRSFRVTFVFKH